MKTLQTLLIGIAFISASAQAQVSVGVGLNVNIGSRPAWAPSRVHTEVRYYYLPDIDTYYDVNTRNYIYITNGRWVRNAYLPVAYRNYDLYSGPKVVVNNYYGPAPYTYYRPYKVKHYKPVKHYRHHDRHPRHDHHHGHHGHHGRH